MITVLGIDSSLTSTGLTRARLDPPPVVEPGTIVPHTLRTVAVGTRSGKLKTRHALARRVVALVDQIDAAITADTALISIENLAYGGTVKGTNAYALPWVFGRVLELADKHHVPVLVVATSQIKKYATGSGGNQVTKDHVLAAALRRYPEANITGNDTADSTVACAIGCRYLGFPIDQVPQKNLEVMTSLEYNDAG